jgi:hypothetical protein
LLDLSGEVKERILKNSFCAIFQSKLAQDPPNNFIVNQKNFRTTLPTKMMNFMTTLTARMHQHPLMVCGGYISLLTLGFGVADYTKEIGTCDPYEKASNKHLCPVLLEMHASGFERQIEYTTIVLNRNRCDEFYYLYQTVEKKIKEAEQDEVAMKKLGKSRIELAGDIVKELPLFTQRLCRRAMLRNGYVFSWFQSMIQDEFIRYYLFPLAVVFLGRQFKKN